MVKKLTASGGFVRAKEVPCRVGCIIKTIEQESNAEFDESLRNNKCNCLLGRVRE